MPVALLFAGGILVSNLFIISPFLLLGISLALALTALVFSTTRQVALCLVALLTGWTNAALRTAVLSPDDIRTLAGTEPALAALRGTLRETPALRVFEHDEKPSWRTMAQLDVTDVRLGREPWRRAVGKVAVTTPGALTNLFGGQVVEVAGVLAQPRTAPADGLFDYRAYLKNLGIYYQLHASSEADWVILGSPDRAPLADRFRSWGKGALAQGLPQEDEALRLEWALTLGWKTALTEEVEEPFVRAAT